MKPIKPLFVFVIAIFISGIFSSCKRDSPSTPDSVIPAIPYTPETVTTTIKGRVLDENRKPIQNASIFTGKETVYTELNGEFVARNISVDRYKTVLTVFQPIYSTTSGVLYPIAARGIIVNPETVNYVEIQLMPQTRLGPVNVTSGGDVKLSSGAVISFPPDAVVNEGAGPSPQNVNVDLCVFDQKTSNYRNIYWGNLRCITKNGEERGLNAYGAVFLNMSDALYNKPVRQKFGKKIKISVPIPAEFLSTAPATIPSWYLSEGEGIWKEGMVPATRVGNNYVLEDIYTRAVACGLPYPLVKITAAFKDVNGNPLAKTNAEIGKTDGTLMTYGITDSLGKITFLAPANQPLKLKLTNNCGAEIYSRNIGPYADAIDLGEATMKSPVIFPVTIKGAAVDCYNQPLMGGAVVTIDGWDYTAPLKDGKFSIDVNRCNAVTDTVKVTIQNYNGVDVYKTVLKNVPSGTYDMGALTVCSTGLKEYISFSYGSINEVVTNNSGSIFSFNTNVTQIYGSKSPINNKEIIFGYPLNKPPAGNTLFTGISIKDYTTFIVENLTANGQISYLPDPNSGFMEGSFSVVNPDPVKGNTLLSCSFRLYKR